MITNEGIFYSTNAMETIRKILKKLNMELISLLKARPQTPEIKERIRVLMEDIHHYGLTKTFNNHIYSFKILIFLLLHVLNKKSIYFYRSFYILVLIKIHILRLVLRPVCYNATATSLPSWIYASD